MSSYGYGPGPYLFGGPEGLEAALNGFESRERGLCHVCRKYHCVTSVSSEEAEIIKHDAQDVADYFRMDNHLGLNGELCKGSGQPPEQLEEIDDYIDDFPQSADLDEEQYDE